MGKISIAKKILILALILGLPGFLYYLLMVKGQNRYEPLSIFGPKIIAKTTHKAGHKTVPDTIYHTLPDFNLHDQDGNPVSLKAFAGKIIVVNFFYTHCPSICSQMNTNMDSLVSAYAKINLVKFVSITVDPEHDTPAALKAYSRKFNVPASKWMFLTGDTATIYPLARAGFLVNALQQDKDNFIYSDKIIMIDSKKRIRGYYSGTSVDDIERLGNELKVQVLEELRENDKPMY